MEFNYEELNIEQQIIMDALKLAEAHTRWKTGKGSMKSFAVAKGIFMKNLREKLIVIEKMIWK